MLSRPLSDVVYRIKQVQDLNQKIICSQKAKAFARPSKENILRHWRTMPPVVGSKIISGQTKSRP